MMLGHEDRLFCMSYLVQNPQVLKIVPKRLIEDMLIVINKKYKGMLCLLETYRFLAKQIDV
jgi:hypothetical protein